MNKILNLYHRVRTNSCTSSGTATPQKHLYSWVSLKDTKLPLSTSIIVSSARHSELAVRKLDKFVPISLLNWEQENLRRSDCHSTSAANWCSQILLRRCIDRLSIIWANAASKTSTSLWWASTASSHPTLSLQNATIWSCWRNCGHSRGRLASDTSNCWILTWSHRADLRGEQRQRQLRCWWRGSAREAMKFLKQ